MRLLMDEYWHALEAIVAKAQMDPKFRENAYRILDTALLGCKEQEEQDRLLDLRLAVGTEIQWLKKEPV
jgi:hypothetical protein